MQHSLSVCDSSCCRAWKKDEILVDPMCYSINLLWWMCRSWHYLFWQTLSTMAGMIQYTHTHTEATTVRTAFSIFSDTISNVCKYCYTLSWINKLKKAQLIFQMLEPNVILTFGEILWKVCRCSQQCCPLLSWQNSRPVVLNRISFRTNLQYVTSRDPNFNLQ